MNDKEIEKKIKEIFEDNYEMLRAEGAHALSQDVKEAALYQVILYWKKLKEIAMKVTDTEVKLDLPEQRTKEGRKYAIEGVVDIVREEENVWMYDIKTHDSDYIQQNKPFYEQQLNLYAHIWQKLRNQNLDHTAIISTTYPEAMKEAILSGDEKKLEYHLNKWQPVIEFELKEGRVTETVGAFAKIVDKIENKEFKPASIDVLIQKQGTTNKLFVTNVCRNCDARYSCSSYLLYIKKTGDDFRSNYKKYINDSGTEIDRENWKDANLSIAPKEI